MKKPVIAALLCLPMLTACPEVKPDADQKQAAATKQAFAEAEAEIGMPDIVNYQERRFAKQILEMRDQSITTHTYIKNDIKGCLVYLGASIGYGLPYAVQYTNPMRVAADGIDGKWGALPQPDPNGLFMPDSLSATWVLLVDEKTKKASPVYVEPEITVSSFRITQAECR